MIFVRTGLGSGLTGDMKATGIINDIESAALAIGRLDARISASPLKEAWQVRASLLAAETLAAVDGTPTRVSDILGLAVGAPLPSQAAYYPAHIGLGHWLRIAARIEFSETAKRILGRKPSLSAGLTEMQVDWDHEDELPTAARHSMAYSRDPQDFAAAASEKALSSLRKVEEPGSVLIGLAKAMQQTVRIDYDPTYFERIYDLRRQVEQDAWKAHSTRIAALTSHNAEQVKDLNEKTKDWLESIVWDKTPHLGACYAVLPDRLVELGFTVNRLSCLTGATKRLGFEGRTDERAFRGFLRQLSAEAAEGLAQLDALEHHFARLAAIIPETPSARSTLPDILYAILVLPAVDTVWLETCLEIHKRVIQKAIKRLADLRLIEEWASKKSSAIDRRALGVRLWALAGYEKIVDRSLRRKGVRRTESGVLDTTAMFERTRSLDISVPMSSVFERFNDELIDIDLAYGRFWPKLASKNRPPQKPVERDLSTSVTEMT